MDDPLSFPVLAGAALTQGFTFLYGQLGTLLERRRAQREGRQVPLKEVVETPPMLAERLEPLEINDPLLAQKADELELLRSLLDRYTDDIELDGRDAQLRLMLGRLRALLEAIYGQSLTFHGEDRPITGIRVEQRANDVRGEILGLDVKAVGERGRGEVSQDFKTVHPGSKVVGARLDSLG